MTNEKNAYIFVTELKLQARFSMQHRYTLHMSNDKTNLNFFEKKNGDEAEVVLTAPFILFFLASNGGYQNFGTSAHYRLLFKEPHLLYNIRKEVHSLNFENHFYYVGGTSKFPKEP